MAHFAKIENGIVTNVVVVDNEHEANGEAYLHSLGLEGTWVQTSYNTRAGQNRAGGAPLRMNYAEIGGSYDADRDAFIPVKFYESWVLNEETLRWEPPVPRPDKDHIWDEETTSWVIKGQ